MVVYNVWQQTSLVYPPICYNALGQHAGMDCLSICPLAARILRMSSLSSKAAGSWDSTC